ncbi:MAG: hypothetical protein KDD33_09440 [Bdellovibrionales bacterium]|nr:hypothetical protein [Bdellovibrionales bacterium]
MKIITLMIALVLSSSALAKDIALTVGEVDTTRHRATIKLFDSRQVPLGTVIRMHSKTGTCEVKITERVNNELIGQTDQNCDPTAIHSGMQLSFSNEPEDNWLPTARTEYTDESPSDWQAIIKDRLSIYLGYNLSNQLEGKVYADGSVKNLEGDSAFTLGVNGRVYDFNPMFSIGAGIGYETPRAFDRATFVSNGGERVYGFPAAKLSLWNLLAQLEARPLDKLVAFGGLNYSLPTLRDTPRRVTGDIGFHIGANYEVYPQIAVEGLIKITNMNLKNEIGETTDVSLAGLELRGRYSF